GMLLPERRAPVGARHDRAELADDPEVVGVAVRHPVQVDVAGIDAGVERALGQLHLRRDLRDRPAAPGVLGVDHGPEVTRAVAPLPARELEAEDVTARSRLRRRPRRAAIARTVDDALLARDPCGAGVDAG